MQHYSLSAEISGLQVRVLPGSPKSPIKMRVPEESHKWAFLENRSVLPVCYRGSGFRVIFSADVHNL